MTSAPTVVFVDDTPKKVPFQASDLGPTGQGKGQLRTAQGDE